MTESFIATKPVFFDAQSTLRLIVYDGLLDQYHNLRHQKQNSDVY